MKIKSMKMLFVLSCCFLSFVISVQSHSFDNTISDEVVVQGAKTLKHATTSTELQIQEKIDSLAKSKENKGHENTVQNVIPTKDTKDNVDEIQNIKVDLEHDAIQKKPEVGKHVMANMDAGSMIISLLMVLVLIIICAFILKRFNLTTQGVNQLKVISSLSLGSKERVIVVQVGEQQLVLGVTVQQITLLEKLSEPLVEQNTQASDLPKSVLSFLSAKKI